MLLFLGGSKMAKSSVKNKKKEEVKKMLLDHEKKISLTLPIPDTEIILAYMEKAENPDLIVRKYLDIVEKAAELESKSLISGLKIKSSLLWKILLVISIFLCLILGMILGIQFKAEYDRFGITVDKKEKHQKKTSFKKPFSFKKKE